MGENKGIAFSDIHCKPVIIPLSRPLHRRPLNCLKTIYHCAKCRLCRKLRSQLSSVCPLGRINQQLKTGDWRHIYNMVQGPGAEFQ